MKKLILPILISIASLSFSQSINNEWHTEMSDALESSFKTQKPLMLFFTGSDWCGWCKKLVKEVYKTSEFSRWAKKNVVLVDIDFPKRTKLSAELEKQNRELAQIFGVRGYPTIWFVNPSIAEDGKVNLEKIGKTGYVRGGPTAWINSADLILNKK